MLKMKWTSNNEADVSLPLGDESTDYVVDVYVKYEDVYGDSMVQLVHAVNVCSHYIFIEFA